MCRNRQTPPESSGGHWRFPERHTGPGQPDHPGDRRLLREQPVREMEQAAEVQPVGVDKRVAIAVEERRQPFRRGCQGGGGTGATARFREQPVDQAKQTGPIRGHLQPTAEPFPEPPFHAAARRWFRLRFSKVIIAVGVERETAFGFTLPPVANRASHGTCTDRTWGP